MQDGDLVKGRLVNWDAKGPDSWPQDEDDGQPVYGLLHRSTVKTPFGVDDRCTVTTHEGQLRQLDPATIDVVLAARPDLANVRLIGASAQDGWAVFVDALGTKYEVGVYPEDGLWWATEFSPNLKEYGADIVSANTAAEICALLDAHVAATLAIDLPAPQRRGRGKAATPSGPSTMKELKDTLWKAADKLRGSMDASQYKDIALGLVFLKYVSDAFEERRAELDAELRAAGMDDEQVGELINEFDAYTGRGVFWVHERARWSYLAANAKGLAASGGEPPKSIGELVDEAMDYVMGANPTLAATLPKIFAKDNVDQRRLGELIDLFNSARFAGAGASKARDLLGEVYEYFLDKFAKAEGKRGGEFYTPPDVVRVLVEVLEPTKGKIYDPCCGSGGMFVQTEKFLAAHQAEGSEISVYGQELNERTWRMAKMNLALHGLNANLASRWGDTFARDQHPDLRADYVLANPPFNIKDWARAESDSRWKYGVPPAGNANYAWIQHILAKLAPGGRAGVVMANGSMSTNSGGEGDIRAAIVEADLVSCMVALPTQLFRSTGIPVCLWFFARDKAAGKQGSVDRRGQVLFIDARSLGYMVDRAERALADADIAKIAGAYRAWRGTRSAVEDGLAYADEAGFCYSASLAEIKAAEYALTPGRYVGAADVASDGEEIGAKIERLTKELLASFDESARLEAVVREQLGRLHV